MLQAEELDCLCAGGRISVRQVYLLARRKPMVVNIWFRREPLAPSRREGGQQAAALTHLGNWREIQRVDSAELGSRVACSRLDNMY